MEELKTRRRIPSSFRDPNGFVFYRNGYIYRQVNRSYKDNYDQLISSGLYETLVNAGLLIRHEEAGVPYSSPDEAYKVIEPEPIPFISYPYEWCFSQLRDAALATLCIQKESLRYGMSLKDCSAYNIQFLNCRPVFIDTLSFEKYRMGQPWVAYRQFCQHFLAPLALMSYTDIRLSQLLRIYIDGVPLDLAASLLPFRSRFKFSLLTHIHLHASSQKRLALKTAQPTTRKMGLFSFLGLIDNLESSIKKLKWRARGTEWVDYYEDTNYSPDGFEHKKQIVAEFLNRIAPKTVWDLGANVGVFSSIASEQGIQVISFDIDPAAVEQSYLNCLKKGETRILPLVLDLSNPSSGIGWEGAERMSVLERGPADAALALALVHHLAISNNIPLDKIAAFLSKICRSAIVEFVPKSDSRVQRLLSAREDVFFNYTQECFEREFKRYFAIQASTEVRGSGRVMYLMQATH